MATVKTKEKTAIIMVTVHSVTTVTDRVTITARDHSAAIMVNAHRETIVTDHVTMVSVSREITLTDRVLTETASSAIMVTDHRENTVTDRTDRKMVIEMAVMKEKTTIIRKASRAIAAAVIILEVIETIDRTVRIVQERREDA